MLSVIQVYRTMTPSQDCKPLEAKAIEDRRVPSLQMFHRDTQVKDIVIRKQLYSDTFSHPPDSLPYTSVIAREFPQTLYHCKPRHVCSG
ncbi:hypothetical protein CesoFtcFv8_004270 [Champsocephalus esox]|nr:hypothetical protein CesoFtcFv8_004270 [Champsocephalus esox]